MAQGEIWQDGANGTFTWEYLDGKHSVASHLSWN